MAKRKIDLQGTNPAQRTKNIDALVQDMSEATDTGFAPTDKMIYQISIDRIQPDFSQPRHFLPDDLRQQLHLRTISAAEAIKTVVKRAESGDNICRLILGWDDESSSEGGSIVEKGLFALANSIKVVGLRQPINVYQIQDSETTGQLLYQIGEGERRFWAHHLLVFQGETDFRHIACLVEPLPQDTQLIYRRQQAENAARQDLSGIARARAISQIRERLRFDLGTRVPGETTIKLPSQRALDKAVGEEVKTFTGRAIGDRMVRNYLRLLQLPLDLQDLAEAAQLTEKQLRPVLKLKSIEEQSRLINQIIRAQMTGQQVSSLVDSNLAGTTFQKVTRSSVEKRLEKRLLQTARTAHQISTMGYDAYDYVVRSITDRLSDDYARESVLAMRKMLDDIIGEFQVLDAQAQIPIDKILPPTDLFRRKLPATDYAKLEGITQSIEQLNLLLSWREQELHLDALSEFWTKFDRGCHQLEANVDFLRPQVRTISEKGRFEYKLWTGFEYYWATLFLIDKTGFPKLMLAELVK